MLSQPMNRRLDDLLSSLCDGRATDGELATLEQMLKSDREALATYLAYIDLHTNLAIDHGVAFSVQNMKLSPVPRSPGLTRAPGEGALSRRFVRSAWPVAAAAAVILLVAALWWMPRPTERTDSQSPVAEAPSVAMLTDTRSAEFDNLAAAMNLGGELSAGPIRLISGQAQLMFKSGAVVDLSGPCEFEITGPNRGHLIAGTLEAYVPNRAHGFALDLPNGAKVLDLGTRFVASADGGDSLVRVIEGRVQLTAGDQSLTLALGDIVRVLGDRLVEMPTEMVESFDAPAMPLALERSGPDRVEFTGTQARFVGGEQQRCYLRTIRDDWHTRSFTAHVDVTVPQTTDPWAIAFFGLGHGEPVADQYGEPLTLPHVMMFARPDSLVLGSHDNDGDIKAQTQARVSHLPGGTHRLGLTWNARSRIATFDIDLDRDGSIDARFEVDGSDNGFDTAASGRILFGGAAGLIFDDLIVVQTPLGPRSDTATQTPQPGNGD